jgi:ParB-like chromosome segregation protein Spo0J
MERAESFVEPDVIDVEQLTAGRVRVDLLAPADSPRRAGEDPEHVRRLAESLERLPPILVHRPSMRVIDGMHRLKAAVLRGHREIDVMYVDGDDASAFVLGVRANITHGLPLTLADRKAAADRIMGTHPQWSDRMIARVTGLAPKTVATMRKRLTGQSTQLDVRVGRDGRVRPVNSAERRQVAARLISSKPGASLREVAETAGLSPETVRRVKAQLEQDLGSPAQCSGPAATTGDARTPTRRRGAKTKAKSDKTSVIRALWADPAFRSNECARALLRMLASYLSLNKHSDRLIDNIPVHCLSRVVVVARACSKEWHDFADRVEQRTIAEESKP